MKTAVHVEEDDDGDDTDTNTVDDRRIMVCPELGSSSPLPPDLSTVNTSKMYFEYINLGAIKISVTF